MGWIQGAIKRPGAFRRKAKARGMSTATFRRYVLKHKGKFSARTRRQAALAGTLSKLRKRRRK